MPLVYFIVGLLNIFTQHHNYGIKMDPKEPNFDIRVRRSIEDDLKPELFYTRYNLGDVLNGDVLETDILKSDVPKSDVSKKRKKRLAYYKKTKITYNDLLKYSPNNNNNSESQTQKNPYDIFNPNWKIPTRNNQNNNTGVKTSHTINNRQLIRSYPYGHPPGYEPRPNRATGYNVVTTTPVFYNYENPNKPNFAGYGGYTANRPAYENVTPGYYKPPIPYAPRSSPNTNSPWNSPLAQYPPTYSQNPINNSVSTTNNSGIHNLPYNNNFNNIPAPLNRNNIPQYAINFNNRTTVTNNKYTLYIPVNNTSVTPEKDYIFPSISDYEVTSNNTVSPTNNNFSPTNNNFSPTNNISPANNTSVTPSNKINATSTTTEITLSGCVICNIPCPRFMRRFGMYCRPEDDDDDDY